MLNAWGYNVAINRVFSMRGFCALKKPQGMTPFLLQFSLRVLAVGRQKSWALVV